MSLRRFSLLRRATGPRTWAEHGQAMVELALTLPILVMLIVSAAEVGDAYNAYLTVVAGARDGARLGSKGQADDATIKALVQTNLGRLRDSTSLSDVTVTRGSFVGSQSGIRVQACNNHRLLINYPLVPLPNPIRICSTTTMRVLPPIS